MSKDPPLSLTSFVEYYREMLKYFKTRVLGKVMIHCYYSRLHFGFSFSFPTLAFFIKQNSISKEVQIGGAVESIRKVMFSFREQPKFFCTVSAALQHSFSGRQKMAGFRRMQTKTSLLSSSRHLLIQNVFLRVLPKLQQKRSFCAYLQTQGNWSCIQSSIEASSIA